MPAHKHAELMAEYAQDAAETGKPWERWQFKWEGSHWQDIEGECLYWETHVEYRRKPKTSRERYEEFDTRDKPIVTGWEIWQEAERQAKEQQVNPKPNLPEPQRELLEMGQSYFYPELDDCGWCAESMWCGNALDRRRLERGLVYLTREDAITAAKAMVREVK